MVHFDSGYSTENHGNQNLMKWCSPWICYFKNPECILLFMSCVPFFNSHLHVYMYTFQLVSNWNVYIICVQTANKIDGALDKMISWFYSWVCCCVSCSWQFLLFSHLILTWAIVQMCSAIYHVNMPQVL